MDRDCIYLEILSSVAISRTMCFMVKEKRKERIIFSVEIMNMVLRSSAS